MKNTFVVSTLFLSLFLIGRVANAQTFTITLATAPKIIDSNDVTFFGAHAAELGKWQYIYDVNVTAWQFAPRFTISGFDPTLIVNQNVTGGFGSGILTQKWDRTSVVTTNTTVRTLLYGAYGNSGSVGPSTAGNWLTAGTPTGLGKVMNNYWHGTSAYTVSAGSDFSGGFPIPDYIRAGYIEFPSAATTSPLSFQSKATSSNVQNGLIATFRIVHPFAPGAINYSGIRFGGTTTGTVLGPTVAPLVVVPEPSTLALVAVALTGTLALFYHRRRRLA